MEGLIFAIKSRCKTE